MPTITDAGIVSDDGRTTIPPDPRNADCAAYLAASGQTVEQLTAAVGSARAARKTAEDGATTVRRDRERKARQAVKTWLAGGAPPTFRQLADAISSAQDDTP